MNNTFATSETLRNEIQWQQPGKYRLAEEIRKMLNQYWTSPKLQAIIEGSRIPQLAEETEELAKLVWDKLVALRMETMASQRVKAYENELDKILKKTPKAIESIMMQDWWKAA